MSVTNLRPAWQKGQSGNPSGLNVAPEAAKQVNEARRLMCENAQKGVARLMQLMDSADERIALTATIAFLDRAGLKPVALEVETTETDENGEKRTWRVEIVRPNVRPSAA